MTWNEGRSVYKDQESCWPGSGDTSATSDWPLLSCRSLKDSAFRHIARKWKIRVWTPPRISLLLTRQVNRPVERNSVPPWYSAERARGLPSGPHPPIQAREPWQGLHRRTYCGGSETQPCSFDISTGITDVICLTSKDEHKVYRPNWFSQTGFGNPLVILSAFECSKFSLSNWLWFQNEWNHLCSFPHVKGVLLS